MNAWRLATVLGLFSAGILASEPAGGPEAELSLELLEFLGEYANEQGELDLPEDFDNALATEPAAETLPANVTPVDVTPVDVTTATSPAPPAAAAPTPATVPSKTATQPMAVENRQ